MGNQDAGHHDQEKGENEEPIDECEPLANAIPATAGDVFIPVFVPFVVEIEKNGEEHRQDFVAFVVDVTIV